VIDINVPRGVRRYAGGAEAHEERRVASIMIGSSVGERVLVPGLVPYSATKGAVKNIYSESVQRGREPGASRSTTCSRVRSTRI